ncbi:MAG: SUMF1/EgtB/PvdO family nonheme iron enzyme [Aliifodinibius sp.]|nr:formylglycine-generating enzyme family protein [candidate division Zixibacteria bacterium]NIT59223.1 formylglycine-generating enzyme family protein [Fodinibius sp.]NIW40484.1 SUMF1/EgtB/PvdO family nonheme iron enzyme [candidate division Zixibacteria bacterium]NIX57807.1 SUMF1/EgtB/PvdO family nonheme iron enzyme [candidate division Zixibacteria bacterium]NIY27806.1 SUMF1/EgtB/PvdO family nonheme iron enzyme [Fodinibius sp.]
MLKSVFNILIIIEVVGSVQIAEKIISPESLVSENDAIPDNFIRFDGGEYYIGDFTGRYADAQPVHVVRLTPFCISPYEVTVGEFRKFVDQTDYSTSAEQSGEAIDFDGNHFLRKNGSSWQSIYFEQTEQHPVTQISWYDAVRYCNWLSESRGLKPCYTIDNERVTCDFEANGYRLPTEAEWEFAATSGGKRYTYSWGNDPPESMRYRPANLKDQTSHNFFSRSIEWGECWHEYNDGFYFTSPVGSFAPNDTGLYDMIGNVYEWCWDWYDKDYYKASPVVNPRGPNTSFKRTCRGNAWNCPPDFTSLQHRGSGKPDDYWPNVGFRIVRRCQ